MLGNQNPNVTQAKDPYNWPYPQKNDSMYLSKIGRDEYIGRREKRAISQDYKVVESSKKTFYNKESFINKVDDIKGAQQNQKQDFSQKVVKNTLNVNDIFGTQPQVTKFRTNRTSNPLQPDYKLPTPQPQPVQDPPRFVRDHIDIRDIDGTKPKKDPWYNKIRNVDPYTEIEGSRSKSMKPLKDFSNKLDVSDINGKVLQRVKDTNPLEPRYTWQDTESKQAVRESSYGYIAGAQPKINHLQRNNIISTLDTTNIQGCQVNTVRENFFLKNTRKDFREPNKTSDIPGAQVGTYIKGLKTRRNLNPLNPSYNLPGLMEQK